MPSQEECLEFFRNMSVDLHNRGYKILDNLIYPFPKIKTEEEIWKQKIKEKHEDEKYEDEDYSEEEPVKQEEN